MRLKSKTDLLKEWFENTYKTPALTKRGLPTKFYFDVLENYMAKNLFKEKIENPKEEILLEQVEIKNFSKCKMCGEMKVAFFNSSYYNMFTVKCKKCGYEIDYDNKEEAFIEEHK